MRAAAAAVNESLNMARKPKRSPSFFKILIGDFENQLRIPPMFVKYVFKGKVPTMFTLNSSDSGSSWRVRVQVQQGNYFFIGGWSKFVKDHCLEIRDFLVFFLIGSSTFDVHIYNRTACAKNIILAAKKRKMGRPPLVNRQNEETPIQRCSSVSRKTRGVSRTRNASEEVEFVSEVITNDHVSFEMVVKKRHKYHACIPRLFARGTGFRKESITKIKDPRGKIWPMNTTVSGGKIRVGAGWSQFVHENKIAVGDTLLFESIPNTGNLLQVVKAGYEKNTSVVAKRRRGRPCKQIEEPPSKKCAPSSKRIKELISEQASFVVVLKDYQMYSIVVPRGFAKAMGLAEKPSTVIKDSKGRKWTLNILVDARSIVRLGAGWSKFVEENKIEVGDSLLFQHIPNTGNVINFEIINKAGEGTRGKRNK